MLSSPRQPKNLCLRDKACQGYSAAKKPSCCAWFNCLELVLQ